LRGSFQKTDWLQGGGTPFLVQDSGKYNKTCNSGQICLMWSTRRLPDVLTETKQISDIEKAFAIQLDEDEAIELYDMTLNEAVTFIEKRVRRQE
jgi:hypothetical protein